MENQTLVSQAFPLQIVDNSATNSQAFPLQNLPSISATNWEQLCQPMQFSVRPTTDS